MTISATDVPVVIIKTFEQTWIKVQDNRLVSSSKDISGLHVVKWKGPCRNWREHQPAQLPDGKYTFSVDEGGVMSLVSMTIVSGGSQEYSEIAPASMKLIYDDTNQTSVLTTCPKKICTKVVTSRGIICI